MTSTDHPTAERIMIAAEPLFAAGGFASVSLRAIAAAAGVPLALVPYHFGSKEGLYRAIWMRWMANIPADVLLSRRAAPGDASPETRVRRLVEALFDGPRTLLLDARGRNFVAIMVREAHDPGSGSRGLLEDFIYPNGLRIRAEFAALFPTLRPDALAAGFDMTISALRIAIEQQDRSEPGGPGSARTFDLLADFVVHGWLGLVGTHDDRRS